MYRQTHRIFGPARRHTGWKSVSLQHGGGFGSFLSRLGSKFVPLFKKAVPAATKVAKKIANSDTAKQMGNILAEKGMEAATDLIGNAIGGDVSAEGNIGNLQKKFVKNLSQKLIFFSNNDRVWSSGPDHFTKNVTQKHCA